MSQAANINKLAVLHYGDGEFVVFSAGSHVKCAITGATIVLPALRYWSVERQEAYLGPLEYMEAHALPNGTIKSKTS